MDTEGILNNIYDKYTPLTKECQTEVLEGLHVLTLKKGFTLVREGQYSDKIYFIVNGCARAFYLKDGKDAAIDLALELVVIGRISKLSLF